MRFSQLSLLLLPLLVLFTVSTSLAETHSCPTLQRSKQGAWLLIIDNYFRVRIEQRGEQVDLGIKVEAVGEDYNRSRTDANSTTALVLQGEVSLSSAHQKRLYAVYASGTTTILSDEQIITVNRTGEVSCSNGDRDAAPLYVSLLQEEGYKVSSRKVATASRDALAAALGL